MSGHSKWANIQHKKSANDARRGKIFTKIIREIVVATKTGGSDPNGNARLKTAILKGKESNMPKDTIERAIKKGAGDSDGTNYEEFAYEGYGPDGVAVLLDIMTDNKNRTASDVRSIFTKMGGAMGVNGSVSYMFKTKGVIVFDPAVLTEEQAMEIGLDAGADDIIAEDDAIEVLTTLENFQNVLKAFDDKNIAHISAEVTKIPDSYQEVSEDKLEKVLNLIEKLEDLDDVQAVYTNLKLPENYKG